jgi:hypothetical protein
MSEHDASVSPIPELTRSGSGHCSPCTVSGSGSLVQMPAGRSAGFVKYSMISIGQEVVTDTVPFVN